MRNQLIISEKTPRGDLTERTKEVLKQEGKHVLYQDDTGRKLIGDVANGRIVDWSAFEDSTEVPTVLFKHMDPSPTVDGVVPRRKLARYALVCACFQGDDDVCWYVHLYDYEI